MKWFADNGSGIAKAIESAKTHGAIFVVYCEGKDEDSKLMTEMINTDSVTSKLESQSFVAIKVESDKEEYMQFAKIYQLVPVPSLFFIKNGVPIKIVTNAIKTVGELEEAIDTVLNNELSKPQSSAQGSSNSKPQPESAEVVCDDGVCYKKPSEAVASSQQPPAESTEQNETEEEKQERIRKAMKLIEQKRIERVQEEQRLEKEREIQRRKGGQEIQNLKKWQEDQELKQIKDDRIREKNEAKADRQRVLDQIEQDKKERAQRFSSQSSPVTPKEPVTPPAAQTPTTSAPNSSRIQFKKPGGESEVVTFDSDMLFADLYLFVKNDILNGSIKDFVLATAFPRREFLQDDFDKTLASLNLTPTAVLLIIPGKKATSSNPRPSSVLPTQTDGSFMAMLGALFTGLMSPVMLLFTYLKNFVYRAPQAGVSDNDAGKRKRNEDILAPNDAAKKRNLTAINNQQAPGTSGSSSNPTGTIPKSGVYKRQNPSNNIHRLHQNSDSDDEEKKTYNGNSTQQM